MRSSMFSLLADLLLAVPAESFVCVWSSQNVPFWIDILQSPSIGKSWNAGGQLRRSPRAFLIRPSLTSSKCTLMAMSNCSQADWLVWTRSDFAYQREDWPARRSRMFSLLVHLRRFWNLFVDLPVAKIDLSKVNIWQSLSIGRWPNFSGRQIFLGFSDSS